MSETRFPCPHCSAPLRIRDRMFVGQQVDCPDCGRGILIVADGPRQLAARAVVPPRGEPAAASRPQVPASLAGAESVGEQQASPSTRKIRTSRRGLADVADSGTNSPTASPSSRGHRLAAKLRVASGSLKDHFIRSLHSPVAVSWCIAGAAGIVFLLLIFRADREPFTTSTDTDSSPTVVDGNAQEQGDEGNGAPTSRTRLLALGRRLRSNDAAPFPAGTVESTHPPLDRLSWLARLVVQTDADAAGAVHWNAAWNDPVNDRFVRRPVAEFLNPGISRPVGESGYPASHFVGVTGVGADSGSLPADHPRAGLFGLDRATRVADLKDGASNTVAVLGVGQHLENWASPAGSLRGLDREPYVNGPDGFGTGEGEEMLLLMADGAVRSFARQADPVILRRMAAIADGHSLDPSLPGEPGDPLAAAGPNRPAFPVAPGGKPAVIDDSEVVEAERPLDRLDDVLKILQQAPPVDVPAALRQQIVAFDQSKPAPFGEVVAVVEELAGVPIHIDPQAMEQSPNLLERPVSFSMKETSVGEILKTLVKSAGMNFTLEKNGVTIHAR